jgi:hypothetical protein
VKFNTGCGLLPDRIVLSAKLVLKYHSSPQQSKHWLMALDHAADMVL